MKLEGMKLKFNPRQKRIQIEFLHAQNISMQPMGTIELNLRENKWIFLWQKFCLWHFLGQSLKFNF